MTSPAIDVAWFMGGCIDVANTGEEEQYLRYYHDRLCAAGVADYAWEECRRDYRLAMVDAVVQGILSATADRPDSAYHTELAPVLERRFVGACERLKLDELVTGKGQQFG